MSGTRNDPCGPPGSLAQHTLLGNTSSRVRYALPETPCRWITTIQQQRHSFMHNVYPVLKLGTQCRLLGKLLNDEQWTMNDDAIAE